MQRDVEAVDVYQNLQIRACFPNSEINPFLAYRGVRSSRELLLSNEEVSATVKSHHLLCMGRDSPLL